VTILAGFRHQRRAGSLYVRNGSRRSALFPYIEATHPPVMPRIVVRWPVGARIAGEADLVVAVLLVAILAGFRHQRRAGSLYVRNGSLRSALFPS
jgi:hypothetical protein